MLKDGAIDETEGMLRERKEEQEALDFFTKYQNKEIPHMETEEFAKHFHNQSEETEKYEKRTKDQLQIAFMSIPNFPDWTMGWYYHLDMWLNNHLNGLPIKIMGFYLEKIAHHISDIYFMDFSSINNDGDIWKCTICGKDIKRDDYDHKNDETEQFEKYVARIQSELTIPVDAIHKYYESIHLKSNWQYHLRWEMPKKGE